ncbi:inactive dipeptidyl peptidase 10 [Galendromus occidentalis]|uniref:Inactive dipeptidyl peptidase 10 n=1 Tax=Galendromus occidentalis TaxID=34638 RepID=A0AAJ7L5X1_9ACAR|nr:inactive dipeptidyl peptidase 10 [Galendromus occidentalis]
MADAYPMYDDEELVSSAPDSRNYKGIGIALLVIIIVCALIVTAVVLLTPPDTGPRVKNPRISLEEILTGAFQPNTYNGSWTSDTVLTFRRGNGDLVQYDVLKKETKVLVTSTTFRINNLGNDYSISPDQRHMLMAVERKSKYRHTFEGKFKVHDVHKKHSYDLPQPSSGNTKGFVQFAGWGNRGSQLIVVWNNNLYYYNSINSPPIQLTNDGVLDVVFNGMPDWVYEEEIFSSNKAFWMPASGNKLCFAKFNDSKVDIEPIPRYGSEKTPSVNQYTRIEELRYPKPGRPIPTVDLFVFKSLPKEGESSTPPAVQVRPPQSLRGKEYYVTMVSWIDENRLLVNFLHRNQTHAVLAVCSDQNRKNADYECVENNVESSETGWVDISQEPIYDAEKTAYFLKLPVNDGLRGKFFHVAKISLTNNERDYLTHGPYDIVDIRAYDKTKRLVYFMSGREEAPGERHLYRVRDTKEDENNVECLTCDMGGGNFTDPSESECTVLNAHFSPTADFYVRECLGPGIPTLALVATKNNTVVEIMDTNDRLRELVLSRAMPQVRNFQAPLTDSYNAAVRLLLPPGLRDEEIIKYPMVVDVYSGPGSLAVNGRFGVGWGHYLASRKNIIYATIDVRGSAGQGETRMHEIYKKLGVIEVRDQIAVVRYLKSELHFIQENHVAIWGWSYGGYVTGMALAKDTEQDPVFCCGISVAPVSNWLYYDAVYTERYMQLPTGNSNLFGYEKADLTRQVENIKSKKYMLIHGTLDGTYRVYSMVNGEALLLWQNFVRHQDRVHLHNNHNNG